MLTLTELKRNSRGGGVHIAGPCDIVENDVKNKIRQQLPEINGTSGEGVTVTYDSNKKEYTTQ